MFPIRDTIPHQRLPVVTVLLILANVAAFLYELSLPPGELERLIFLNGIVPRRFTDPQWASAVQLGGADGWSLLTSMFLHGGWAHLLSNLWTLWIFGDNVEDRLGSVRYLLFYVASGLVAGLLHLGTNGSSAIPTIGASGAIAGVMGAYFISFPRAQIVTLILLPPMFVLLPAVLYLGFWFVAQLVSGASSLGGAEVGGVAWWAHVGGFVAGIALLALLGRGRRAAEPDDRRGPPPPVAAWLALLAPLLAIALGGCARELSAWRAELDSEDRHTQLVAAIALAREHPRTAGPAIRVLLRHVDDESAWNRAGAERALASIEARRPELLLEFLVLKGGQRPDVLEALLPVFARAGSDARRRTLELVREHAWEAPGELVRELAEAVRDDPVWRIELERELEDAPADVPPDAKELRALLGSTPRPHSR